MKQIILVLLLAAVLLPTAYSQPAQSIEPRHQRVIAKLNLTDTQHDQFKKIHYETAKKNIDTRAKLESARLEIKHLMDSENIDRASVEKKITEISSIEASLKINRFNAWADCNKLLNADQQKIWKKALAMNQMQKMMRQREIRRERMRIAPLSPDIPMKEDRQ